jgi:hypothetical protein
VRPTLQSLELRIEEAIGQDLPARVSQRCLRTSHQPPPPLFLQVCEACPEGGYCAGGLVSPVPCGPLVYDNSGLNELSADWEWQCIKEDGGYWAGEGEALFFMCEGEHCLGGIKSDCAVGHTSRMCSQCDAGYFSIATEELGCLKCPGGKVRVNPIEH